MAQMVKAIRMILGMDYFGSSTKQLVKDTLDIEVEDDAPKRKPSLEEIDALEVHQLNLFLLVYILCPDDNSLTYDRMYLNLCLLLVALQSMYLDKCCFACYLVYDTRPAFVSFLTGGSTCN